MDVHVRGLPFKTRNAYVCAMKFLTMVGLGLLVFACTGKDDAATVRQLIEKSVRSAEEKHIGDLMDLADENFVAMPGHYDAGTVRTILFSAFRHYGKFKIYYPEPTVEILSDGGSAAVTLYFVIVRQNQVIPGLKEFYDDPRRWLERVGEKADLYQLELRLSKKDERWKVQWAQLEGFKGAGF